MCAHREARRARRQELRPEAQGAVRPGAETLGNPTQIGFMMRQKDAETDPFTQIKSAVGSGPFLFLQDEWVPGAKVVYKRNPNYKPRSEPADGYAGGKVTISSASSGRSSRRVRPRPLRWRPARWIIGPIPAPTSAAIAQRPNVCLGLLDPLGWQLHVRLNSLASPSTMRRCGRRSDAGRDASSRII